MSETIEDLLYATLEMGENPFAPFAQVLQLAGRWAAHEDVAGVLTTLDNIFDHEALRVRNVCLIALRNMGEAGRACDPDVYDRLALGGMRDEKANVRLFAAWLAGTFAAPGSEVHAALKAMIAELGSPDPGSQEEKTLDRARRALAEIDARAG